MKIFSNPIIIIAFILLQIVTAVNWQAHGNFTASNITLIQSEIAICKQKLQNNISVTNVAIYLSATLNNTWDPAWSVAITLLDQTRNGDLIVDGYAFRNHWYWQNDRDVTGYSFVLWKDYNCYTWRTLDWTQNDFRLTYNTTLDRLFRSKISKLYAQNTALIPDIWQLSWQLRSWLDTTVPTSDFTVLVSDSIKSLKFGGRFCVHDLAAYDAYPAGDQIDIFVLEMRYAS